MVEKHVLLRIPSDHLSGKMVNWKDEIQVPFYLRHIDGYRLSKEVPIIKFVLKYVHFSTDIIKILSLIGIS